MWNRLGPFRWSVVGAMVWSAVFGSAGCAASPTNPQETWLARLEKGPPKDRALAARKLGERGSPEAFLPLLEAWRDSPGGERYRMIVFLTASARAVGIAATTRDSDHAGFDGEMGWNHCLFAAGNRDDPYIAALAEILRRSGGRTLPQVEAGLAHREPSLRCITLALIGSMPEPGAYREGIRRLVDDPNPVVRHGAADILMGIDLRKSVRDREEPQGRQGPSADSTSPDAALAHPRPSGDAPMARWTSWVEMPNTAGRE